MTSARFQAVKDPRQHREVAVLAYTIEDGFKPWLSVLVSGLRHDTTFRLSLDEATELIGALVKGIAHAEGGQ